MHGDRTYQLDTLLGHIVDHHEIYFANIQSFFSDRSGNKDIVYTLLEIVDGLTCQPYSPSRAECQLFHLLLLFLVEALVLFLFALRLTDEFGSLEQIRMIIQHILFVQL